MGPLWLDIDGCELDAEDIEILAHPTVGGVILFSRNYYDNAQLKALTLSIRKAAKKTILIGVDQEGGRVQRFKKGFTVIPPAQSYAQTPDGLQLAEKMGWTMATELMQHHIDLSFAPVLDKGFNCPAIGSRAFGDDIQTVLTYSSAFLTGMKNAGMVTTGKHFPGHGAVLVDSHKDIPIDKRDNLFNEDMLIFKAQIDAGLLDAMMPAHVIYPAYDDQPASGSSYWLKKILRTQLKFKGVIFSDDLNMEGAKIMGDPTQRAQQALQAGCDMVLLCNNRKDAIHILDHLRINNNNPRIDQLSTINQK